MYRLSTDVGGTFTDGVLLDTQTGGVILSKVLSTPSNPATGTVECIEQFHVSLKEVESLCHGTTVVINALIEGTGARVGLITTSGFKDVLEIGRGNRVEMYDPLYEKPKPQVPRYLRLEAKERIDAQGNILIPLDEDGVVEAAKLFQQEGVEAIAVCLLNSYTNPKHEDDIGRLIAEYCKDIPVSLSHNITQRYYEYERMSTTVQNAYVMPLVRGYLRSLEKNLLECGFQKPLQIMQSSGGIMLSNVAADIPIAMVESGPASGAIGAARIGEMVGFSNVISYDMGGTTAKVALITDSLPETTDQYVVEGRPILLPVIDLREIGAGGGSIAWVDQAGALHVGPKSAGAAPGPACYMRGGKEPTVTDANLVIGTLDPSFFLGGEMKILPDLAEKAIGKIGEHYEMTVDDAALGIIEIVNTNMSGLLQSMTVKKGYDPRDFALVAYGGGGPTHSCAIAKELSIPTVVVPPLPGVFSAWGMMLSDMRHDFTKTCIARIDKVDLKTIREIYTDLESKIKGLFAREQVPSENISLLYEMDMRYHGQEHTLCISVSPTMTVQAKDSVSKQFDEIHHRTYGHSSPGDPKEVVSLRVTGIGSVQKPKLVTIPSGGRKALGEARLGPRRVYQGRGQYEEFSIYRRESLLAGNVILGPAIIEERTSTTVLQPGDECLVDKYGSLVIDVGKEN